MKTIASYSVRGLATVSTVLLTSGLGFLMVCLIQLVNYEDVQAKRAWDLGLNLLISGLVTGSIACKANQIKREWGKD